MGDNSDGLSPTGTAKRVSFAGVSKVTYVWPKMIYFTLFSGLGVLLPFLPVFYHSQGLSKESIGFLGAVGPCTTSSYTIGPVLLSVPWLSCGLYLCAQMTATCIDFHCNII